MVAFLLEDTSVALSLLFIDYAKKNKTTFVSTVSFKRRAANINKNFFENHKKIRKRFFKSHFSVENYVLNYFV